MSAEHNAYEQVQPFWFDDSDRHHLALKEAADPLMLRADDGQQYSALHFNRDFTDRPLMLILNAWMTATNSPEQVYKGYQYAAAHPDRSVLMVDMPSHGYSDKLTDAQLQEIREAGTLTKIGAAQAQAVRRRLPYVKEMILSADSLGARMAPDFAHEAGKLDINPLLMVGFEMVGLEDRPSIAVAADYFIRESWRSRDLYKNNPKYHLLNDAYELRFKRELREFGYQGSFKTYDVFKDDPRLLSFSFAHSPLARDTGAAALERVLDTQQQLSASLVIGGLSHICRWRKIAPTVQRLEDQFPDRLSHEVWPHDNHAMNVAPQQPRMAAYVKGRVAALDETAA